MKKLSGWIIAPVYNEERLLPSFLHDLWGVLEPIAELGEIQFQVLVVDDGSTDRSREVLAELADAGPPGVALRSLSFIRNFGHQAALVAGMLEASDQADFVVTLDADGEHPTSLIPELIRRWRAGAPIVHTVRKPHKDLGMLKRRSSEAYYALLRIISGIAIRSGMADFKLWDGTLVRQVKGVLPTCGSLRVFASWLVPEGEIVSYEQHMAKERTSRFSARKMWSLAIQGVVSYSELPLRLSSLLGASAVAFGAVLAAFVAWASWAGRTVPGWASTVMAIAVLSGLQSFAIGILGEYLLRNWFRRSLPPYVIAAARHLDEQQRKEPSDSRATGAASQPRT